MELWSLITVVNNVQGSWIGWKGVWKWCLQTAPKWCYSIPYDYTHWHNVLSFHWFHYWNYYFFNLILDVSHVTILLYSVVNIGATALVTEAATAIFGEAGVSAATGVMTVWFDFRVLVFVKIFYFLDIKTCWNGLCIYLIVQNSDQLPTYYD